MNKGLMEFIKNAAKANDVIRGKVNGDERPDLITTGFGEG